MPGNFLAADNVNAAISALARAEKITIFVGAGASMEVGLPSWPTLVDRLLARVATDLGLSDGQAQHFGQSLAYEADGVIGAATVVRAHFATGKFKGDADEFIRQSLYQDPESGDLVSLSAGPTAKAVAKLVDLWPNSDLEIVTTNYDLLLEHAVYERQLERDGATCAGGVAGTGGPALDSENRRVIRHLHGALNCPGDKDADLLPIVIAEGDYHEVQGDDSWQREFMVERLQSSVCLFLGASMTDVNVLRFLRLAKRGENQPRHIALLTRTPDANVDGQLRDALRYAAQGRWSEYGVTVLNPDYYLETSQFVEELSRRRQAVTVGSAADQPTDRYRARLIRWQETMAASTMPLEPSAAFVQAQDSANDMLQNWLPEFIEMMPPKMRADCTRESFGLQLWAVSGAGDSLLLWAQSTNAWRDAKVFEAVPARLPSQWGSVQAYCAGSPVLQLLPDSIGTRWRSALNVPIFLDDAEWGRLPVGVLSLSAMHRHGIETITKLGRAERDAVVNVMAEAAISYYQTDTVTDG